MSSSKKFATEADLKKLSSYIIFDSETGAVKRVVFPNSIQVGLPEPTFSSARITISGTVESSSGFTGSLSNLPDGRSYLRAGTNITITSASDGQLTISATGGSGSPAGSSGLVQYNNAGSFGGGTNFHWDNSNERLGIGTTSPTHVLSVVGAVSASLGLSGSLTRLVDGTSYLVAGSNVTITSASNGQVTIGSSAGGGMTSFTLAGDTGSPQTIGDGNTLSVLGGLGTSTDASATDTLTINIDYVGADNFIEGHTGTGTPASGDKVLFSDIDDNNIKKCTVSQLLAVGGGSGGGSGDYQSKSSNFSVGTSEYMFGVDTSSGGVTATLPACASAGAGKQYIFKDITGHASTNNISIATNGSEKIDGAASANIMVASGSMTLMTDGSNWFVIGIA